jgi:hypothetical protein
MVANRPFTAANLPATRRDPSVVTEARRSPAPVGARRWPGRPGVFRIDAHPRPAGTGEEETLVLTHVQPHRPRAFAAIGAALWLGLAGCEGTFTGDLAAEAPADVDVVEVNVSLRGLRFAKSGGSTTTLEFSAPEPVDLHALAEEDGDPLRLFTDEPLPDGNYAGVRLLLDEDVAGTVVDVDGNEFALDVESGEYADVQFSVAEDESDSVALTLTLDLRQSLAFDATAERYTLTPALRVVRSGRASGVEGLVGFDCAEGDTLERGGALYLFAGPDVVPDDLDGVAPEPYATTRVRVDAASGDATYALRNLAPGDYTLALTCQGGDDELGEDDGLAFHGVRNVALASGETSRADFD